MFQCISHILRVDRFVDRWTMDKENGRWLPRSGCLLRHSHRWRPASSLASTFFQMRTTFDSSIDDARQGTADIIFTIFEFIYFVYVMVRRMFYDCIQTDKYLAIFPRNSREQNC